MKITRFENKLVDLIINKKDFIFFVGITCIAIFARISMYNFATIDFTSSINSWIEQYNYYGGFPGLGYHIGDYNCIYNIILATISVLPFNYLYSIKFVSTVFDLICAIFGYKIIYEITGNKKTSLVVYVVLLLSPVMMINSGAWAQCDSIYTAFALISIYYLIKEKYLLSFIMAGLSFSFKLQFVFILPVYIICYICTKKFSALNFIFLPLINFICAIPSILFGRDLNDIFSIYFYQVEEYGSELVMNFPNIFSLGSTKYFGMILCFALFGVLLYVIVSKKVEMSKQNILLLCVISPIIATYLLPHIHDRYLYLADVFSIVWFLSQDDKSFVYVPITINLVSFSTYTVYLFGTSILDRKTITIIYLVVIFKFAYDISNKVLNKNAKI